jgi:hypothetical protein
MGERAAARFRATAGELQEFGSTPQEAFSALMRHLPEDTTTPIFIWPYNRGDAFFTDAQQARLRELKQRLADLTPEERAELEDLVAESFDATIARSRARQSVKA